MSRRDLTNKYGKNLNTHRAINAAIRAEIPGGNEALDALEAIRDRGADPLAVIRDVVKAMADEICRRYGLQPARDRD